MARSLLRLLLHRSLLVSCCGSPLLLGVEDGFTIEYVTIHMFTPVCELIQCLLDAQLHSTSATAVLRIYPSRPVSVRYQTTGMMDTDYIPTSIMNLFSRDQYVVDEVMVRVLSGFMRSEHIAR